MTDLLRQLKKANASRCPQFGHKIQDWTPTDWATALAGEVGEMCNLIKKKHRGDDINVLDIQKEAADVLTYLDILCQRLDIDLSTATIQKFNEVSERIGSDIKINYFPTISEKQDQYEQQLWQIIRMQRFNVKISVALDFTPDFGVPLYKLYLKINNEIVFYDHGVNLWKRYKTAIEKLHELGYK